MLLRERLCTLHTLRVSEAGRVAQSVEHLPRMCIHVGLVTSTTRKGKERRKKKEREGDGGREGRGA